MNPKITLVGRLGTLPEKMGATGVRFRIVTADRTKTDTGNWEEKDASWWTVKAWRGLADQTAVLQKGQEVIIVGTISQDTWTDTDGSTRTSYDITADSIAISTFSLTDRKAPVATAERIPVVVGAVDPWASA
jgi:single-strand DNA-binding protein